MGTDARNGLAEVPYVRLGSVCSRGTAGVVWPDLCHVSLDRMEQEPKSAGDQFPGHSSLPSAPLLPCFAFQEKQES